MKISDISVPSIYKSSADFRFFMKWFEYALTKLQCDITNTVDLYDALRCPKDLLWMLADTMGYQYDDRFCAAFNRFILLYFMSMIRYKGSQLGITLAAEVNLKQKAINEYGKENDILYNRLEDTSIPANSVYVESNVEDSCINIIYFTDEKPVDACIEYVRPIGMYCFQHAGVRIDSLTKISVDARLANTSDATGIVGPTKVGHYSRNDYARMQKMRNDNPPILDIRDTRAKVYPKNSAYDESQGIAPSVDAGYRALSSLQMANNEHTVKSLFSKPIFDLGYGPIVDTVTEVDVNDPKYNLRYNRTVDLDTQQAVEGTLPVETLNTDETQHYNAPVPKVNGIMLQSGDSMDN